MSNRYQIAVAAMEAAHMEDPNKSLIAGNKVPSEWLYIQRLKERLQEFETDVSEEVRLAANCQHFRRWEINRSDYPEGKEGYFQWRDYLANYQADKVGGILAQAGYPTETADRLRSLIAKENLHEDEDSQTLEDVVCLVFLEHYLEDFAIKNPHLEFRRIILKTMAKMSKEGIAEAKKIQFPAGIQEIIDQVML